MERVKVLIDKLVQQQQQKESVEALLITTQLLQNELLLQQKNNRPSGSSKVAVVMPSVANPIIKREVQAKQAPVQASEQVSSGVSTPAVPQPAPVEVSKPVAQPAAPVQIEEAVPAVEESKPEPIVPIVQEIPAIQETPVVQEEPAVQEKPVLQEERIVYSLPEIPEHESYLPQKEQETHFDAIEETPTLAQYQPPKIDNKLQKEINELIGEPKETLNDRLKENRKELAHVLKETPIKDLRKAIGVNDRFVFVNELFRGDETMYERSIKTINGFHILPEAEYWINRELKVKLGWDDHKDSVQHFYHLVRRRFS